MVLTSGSIQASMSRLELNISSNNSFQTKTVTSNGFEFPEPIIWELKLEVVYKAVVGYWNSVPDLYHGFEKIQETLRLNNQYNRPSRYCEQVSQAGSHFHLTSNKFKSQTIIPNFQIFTPLIFELFTSNGSQHIIIYSNQRFEKPLSPQWLRQLPGYNCNQPAQNSQTFLLEKFAGPFAAVMSGYKNDPLEEHHNVRKFFFSWDKVDRSVWNGRLKLYSS